MPTNPFVEDGFETLAESARGVLDKAGGGAFCIYLRDEPVVDIWSGFRDPASRQAWEPDSMAMAWSTTKGVASTVLHMLVEQGLLAYDSPIVDFWPEFGGGSKAAITLRHLMSMEAGLYDVRHLIDDPFDMLDHATMASHLESATPLHEPGKACAYHAFTYGWLAGELVRRVTGSTIGEFVTNEIATPLDLDGFHIGVPASELGRVAARPSLKPETSMAQVGAKALDPIARLAGFSPRRFAAAFFPRNGYQVIATPEFLTAEVPGINGCFTARSLAKFYATLISEDGDDGDKLWTGETRRLATEQQNNSRDLVVPLKVGWRLGYHQPFPKKRTSTEAFGFYGSYGSGAFADPSRDLAIGLVVQEASGLPLNKLVPKILTTVDGLSRPTAR